MSDINDIYLANPLTELGANDLLYVGADPGGTPADAAIAKDDLFAQIETDLGISELQALATTLGNYKLVPSISSSDLVLVLKDLAGNDFSVTNPLKIKLSDTLQTITGALSVTKADGTNWANMGSNELKTLTVDLFAYLILETGASAGVKLAWSRIPYGTVVGDFSSTTTNEKYLAGPTNYNATDKVQNIGRFGAILGAGAGYLWTLPSPNVIKNEPTYQTRVLTWSPQWTNLTLGNATIIRDYVLNGVFVDFIHNVIMGNSSSVAGAAEYTLPFSSVPTDFLTMIGLAAFRDTGTDQIAGQMYLSDVNKARPFAFTTADADTYARQRQMNATIPFTWSGADLDQVMTTGRYKIA